MSKTQDYSRVFSQLCHMVVLSKEGQIQAVVDDLVATAITIEDNSKITTIEELSELIEVYFGLSLDRHYIQASVDSYREQGILLQNDSSAYVLAPVFKAQIQTRIKEARQLEDTVRTEWLIDVEKKIGSISSPEADQLWSCLRIYLGKAFQRHGAQTISLLDPEFEIGAENRKHLGVYLDEAIQQSCTSVTQEIARVAVKQFFTAKASPARTRYVAQLLDGTFTFFALTTDEVTSSYLKGIIPSTSLFLDTNFIFGILNLHSNPLDDVSHELVNLIKRHGFPFKLYYHKKTLDELERTIAGQSNNLRGRRWKQATSRAVLEVGGLSGLEMRYHEKNAEAPMSVDVFLSKYNHVETLLDEQGFIIYRASAIKQDLDEQKALLIAEYEHYNSKSRPHKPKAYEALDHDISVWQTVRELRQSQNSVLDAGAFFLTNDYDFFSFCISQTNGGNRAFSQVILPSQFLQLLRPFIPATDDFNKSFFEVFAIPEFRTINSGDARLLSEVISYLNTYADMNEKTAIRILTDEMLLQKIKDVPPESDEFGKIIDSEIVRTSEKLIEENEQLESKVLEANERAKQARRETEKAKREAVIQAQGLETKIATVQETAKQQIEEMQSATEQFRIATEERLTSQEVKLQRLESERNRFNSMIKFFY